MLGTARKHTANEASQLIGISDFTATKLEDVAEMYTNTRYSTESEIADNRPTIIAAPKQDWAIPSTTKGKQKMSNTMIDSTRTAVERPILVCGVNILKANKPTLVAIVRELNGQIEQDKDMAKLSTAFAKDAELIQESIDLVIKQIDEGNKLF